MKAGRTPFNKLRHRVFLYILLMVLLSQVAVLILFYCTRDQEYRLVWLEDYVGSLGKTMSEEDLQSAMLFLRHINRHGARMWIENEAGTIMAGEATPGFSAPERDAFSWSAVQRGTVSITDTHIGGRTTFCRVPVLFGPQPAFLCYAFPGYSTESPINGIFLQGLAALLLGGTLASFLAARSLAAPLQRLREDILELADSYGTARPFNDSTGLPQSGPRAVEGRGYDEAADIADAVNTLSVSLFRHIEAMGSLAANTSHELRSPLTRMRLYADMLEDSLVETQQASGEAQTIPSTVHRHDAAEKLGRLQEELAQLEEIVSSNLLLNRLRLDPGSVTMEPVHFSGLAGEMLRRYRPLLSARGMELTDELEPDLWVLGEEALLCHMVSNLLDNCLKYAENEGGVKVYASRTPGRGLSSCPGLSDIPCPPGHLVCAVHNKHRPLPGASLEKLFDPFFRAGGSTGNGTGLGLALVRQIAHLHGGVIQARNAGGGFAVVFTLPLLAGLGRRDSA